MIATGEFGQVQIDQAGSEQLKVARTSSYQLTIPTQIGSQ